MIKQKLLALAAILAACLHRLRRLTQHSQLATHNCVTLANIAEGQHLASQGITYEADSAITERFLLAKRGGATNRVAICGAADTPIGVIDDEAAAAGDLVNVKLFHSDQTLKMVCSAGIAQDALVEPSNAGRIQTLAGSAGTHHVVGRAAQAGVAGDVIEVFPSYFLRVI